MMAMLNYIRKCHLINLSKQNIKFVVIKRDMHSSIYIV